MAENPGEKQSETTKEERRIGVYICHCGGNISDYVNVEEVRKAIENEPGVAVAKTTLFACSDSTQQEIIDDIKEKKLDGLVVASCSPKLHLLTFRGVAKRAGLNPYQYIQVNIREQDSWAHSDNPEGATEKAIRLVRAGIAKARESIALTPLEMDVVQKVLVIGAGIAGIRAALELADMGIYVFLIEKAPFIGGRVSQWGEIFPTGEKGVDIIKSLTEELKKRKNITLFTNTELKSIGGFVGNFDVEVVVNPRYVKKSCDHFEEAIKACPVEVPDEYNFGLTMRKAIYKPYEGAHPGLPAIDMSVCTKCGECLKVCGDAIDLEAKPEKISLNVGAIITATGFDVYEPKEGEFGYKTYPDVITLPQMKRLIELNDGSLRFRGKEIKDIAFIYCVGSRQKKKNPEDKVNEYCSRYCCTTTTFTATVLKEKFGKVRTYHLYRDIRTYGKYEIFYEKAQRDGAFFLRYDENKPPTVTKDGDKLKVTVEDLLTNRETIDIGVDLVVLVTGMVPRKNEQLDSVLKLPLGRDRFYNEIHPKLRPVETVITGVYIAGTCQGPKNSFESVSSALTAVAKASSLALQGKVALEPLIAFVDPEKCVWCGKCAEACPYGAFEKVQHEEKEVAWVREALCKGCGACVPVCPVDAIDVHGYTDREIKTMIDSLVKEEASK